MVINELMVNPQRVYDSRGEWIELYNRGDEPPTSRVGRSATRSTTTRRCPRSSSSRVDYALLARNGDTFRNGGVAADHVYGNSIILWNIDDLLVLRDADGDGA